MKRRLVTFALALVLAASPLHMRGRGLAQDAPTPGAKKIAAEERHVRDALDQLDERMHKLAQRIQEKQPEEAARLEAAWKTIHDKLIKEDLETIVQALEEGSLWKALPKEQEVQSNLGVVLDILERQRQEDVRELDKKLADIQEALKDINKVQQEEQ
jgi:phosphoenolpyruvate-protein kinase (PTS system EI component)